RLKTILSSPRKRGSIPTCNERKRSWLGFDEFFRARASRRRDGFPLARGRQVLVGGERYSAGTSAGAGLAIKRRNVSIASSAETSTPVTIVACVPVWKRVTIVETTAPVVNCTKPSSAEAAPA